MPQVKFLSGQYQNLKNIPLSEGSIYFTEDTRRLYIDTATSRLPVAGDYISGKIFWVKLNLNEWTAENTQTIDTYYESKEPEAIGYPISSVLTEDSVIFLGRIDNQDTSHVIIAKEVTSTGIIFQRMTIENSSIYLSSEDDVYVQIYCPNPKTTGYEPVEVFKTVFTRRIYLDATKWIEKEEKGVAQQTISFPNMDLTTMPYFINLSDDSLENNWDYANMRLVELSSDTLAFEVSQADLPDYNIAVDFCIIINESGIAGSTSTEETDQVTLTIAGGASLNENYINVNLSNQKLRQVPDGEQREFIVYCSTPNEDYNKVESVTYNEDTNQFKITFKENFVATTTGFTCHIIQLNNLANIHKIILEGGENWHYSSNNSNLKQYYYQIWPKSESNIRLNLKHIPIIYPNNKADYFNFKEIVETKIFNNRIQFWTKKQIEDDLSLTIIEWL